MAVMIYSFFIVSKLVYAFAVDTYSYLTFLFSEVILDISQSGQCTLPGDKTKLKITPYIYPFIYGLLHIYYTIYL